MDRYTEDQRQGITAAKEVLDRATTVAEWDEYLTDLLVKAYPTKVGQDN